MFRNFSAGMGAATVFVQSLPFATSGPHTVSGDVFSFASGSEPAVAFFPISRADAGGEGGDLVSRLVEAGVLVGEVGRLFVDGEDEDAVDLEPAVEVGLDTEVDRLLGLRGTLGLLERPVEAMTLDPARLDSALAREGGRGTPCDTTWPRARRACVGSNGLVDCASSSWRVLTWSGVSP